MKLNELKSKNFRCLANIKLVFDPLTVLIGENDAGKSSVLDLLDIFFNNKQPEDRDFLLDKTGQAKEKIEVILTFDIDDRDAEVLTYSINGHVTIKKIYSSLNGAETYYLGLKPEDDRLAIDLPTLNATAQRDLLLQIDPTILDSSISNSDKRSELFQSFVNSAKKREDWLSAPSQLLRSLPRFERYTAMDYNDPANIVSRILKQIYESTIYEDIIVGENVTRRLIEPLRQVENISKQNIQAKLSELQEYIHKYNQNVKGISYEPVYDFKGSLRTGEFWLDRGFGLHSLSTIGDGTKRRMFMAVTDWDREVTIEQSNQSSALPQIIRGYDEPDANLHYDAQKLMYYSISDIVNSPNSHIQAILCTHSLTMIDRAPAQNIRLFRLDANGYTNIERLITNEDPDIENFLQNLALELGITNSIMFYERCLVLIEGDTENISLPIFYRRLFGKSLIEDCIRIINVSRNSAVREFLKVLGINRKDIIIIFIDKDSENNRNANLSPRILKELGFDQDFINNKIIYIGTKEFEDSFSDIVIARVLNINWRKTNGTSWKGDDISAIRNEGKFSEKLKSLVWANTNPEDPQWTKPIFGRVLAETCTPEEIPKEIYNMFKLARTLSGAVPLNNNSSEDP